MSELREKVARALCEYDYRWNTTLSVREKRSLIDEHCLAYRGRADAVLAIAIEECAKVLKAEAEACLNDIRDGDLVGAGMAQARSGALLTAIDDIRALHPSRTGERG